MAPQSSFESPRRPGEGQEQPNTPEDNARKRVENVQRSIPANESDRQNFWQMLIEFLKALRGDPSGNYEGRGGYAGRYTYGASRSEYANGGFYSSLPPRYVRAYGNRPGQSPYEGREGYGGRYTGRAPRYQYIPGVRPGSAPRFEGGYRQPQYPQPQYEGAQYQPRFEAPLPRIEDVGNILGSLQVNGMKVESTNETFEKDPRSFLAKNDIKGERVSLYLRSLKMAEQRLSQTLAQRYPDFKGRILCDGFRLTAQAEQASGNLKPGDKIIANSGDVFIERAGGKPGHYETADGKYIVIYEDGSSDSKYQYYENNGGQPGRRVQQDIYYRHGLLRNRSWVDGLKHLAASGYGDRNQDRPSNVVVYDQAGLSRIGNTARNAPPQGLSQGFNVVGENGGSLTTFANWARARGINTTTQNPTQYVQQYAREIAGRIHTPREIAQFISGTLGTRDEYRNNWHPGEGGKGARMPAGVEWEYGKFRHPLQALYEGKADCRSASLIAQYLLKLNGIESIVARTNHGHYKCMLLERSTEGYTLVGMDEFGYQKVVGDAKTPEEALRQCFTEPRKPEEQPQEVKDLIRETGIDASQSGVHYQLAWAVKQFKVERDPKRKQGLQQLINSCNAVLQRNPAGGISFLDVNGGGGVMSYDQATAVLSRNFRGQQMA